MTMIGMPVGKKSPKSELHEFYQLHPGNPTFVIKSLSNPPAESLFLCTLTCPAIGGPQGLPEQSFTGQGRNKKTAEQYASVKALKFLRDKGLLAPGLIEMDPAQLPAELQRQLQAGGHASVVSLPPQHRCVPICTPSCSIAEAPIFTKFKTKLHTLQLGLGLSTLLEHLNCACAASQINACCVNCSFRNCKQELFSSR